MRLLSWFWHSGFNIKHDPISVFINVDFWTGGKKKPFLDLTLSFCTVFLLGCIGNVGMRSDLSYHSRSALKARGQKIITMGQ